MIAEKLRKAVLQAAMEGKLTNQLLNDSKTIITIDKKYAEIQQEQIPYTIPEKWKWFRVKELFVIRNGFTPLRSNMDFWNSKDVPWFTVNDIRNQGRVITYTDQYISNLAVTDNKVVPKKSILLCCTASIGEYALTKIDLTTNQQFNGMTIKDKYQEFIDIWFVYYWVQTIKEEMISKAGKTTFPFLSVTKLGDFLIPLPPIEEQKRIVEKLEVLLAEIDKLEQDEKALKELENKFPEKLKNAIMLSGIQGNLSQRITTKEESSILKKKILDKKEELIERNIIRKEKQYPIEENEVFIIPDEWESIELADIVHFTKMIKKKTADKLPYLDVKSLRKNEYNNFRTNGEAVEAGDYAILVDGQNSGEIFKISKKGFLGSTLRKIVINPIIEHNYALLILDFYKNTFRDNKRGAAIPHLDFKIFNTSIVPLPSSIEQKHIIEKLDKIFAVDLLNI